MEEGSSTTFLLPPIMDHPSGWGPSGETSEVLDTLNGVPFLPYSKNERVGKVADWSQGRAGHHAKSSYHQRREHHHNIDEKDNPFDYYYAEDETDFHIVDKKVVQSKPYRSFRGQRYQRYDRQKRNAQIQQRKLEKKKYGRHYETRRKRGRWNRWSKNRSNYWYSGNRNVTRRPSIKPKSDWEVVKKISMDELDLYFVEKVPEAKTIVSCGYLNYFDTKLDAVSAKTKVALKGSKKSFFKVTTADDPVIRKLVTENYKSNVFVTDAIMSLLMASPRSINSWDIIVRRVGTKLFFDKRDKSLVDFQPVNETAPEPPTGDKDAPNSPEKLSIEACFVHQKFVSQSLMEGDRVEFERPNPFKGSTPDAKIAPVGYRYRKWNLSDGNVVVCRCEVDGVVKDKKASDEKLLTIRTLHEHDPLGTAKTSGIDWRMKMDTQRGGILANELKNNSNKLAQWTLQSVLADTELIKLGLASRVNPKDPAAHVLLGVMTFRPDDFIKHTNLKLNNAWGAFEYLVETCLALDEGTYLLFKEPNERNLLLYSCPGDAPFEDLEEEEES